MSDLICKLHEIAVYFHRINMRQTAGDLDYIASWLRSPLWNHGEHLKPDPAGENTVDAYSHNCPIPYTANPSLIDRCSDLDAAAVYAGMAKDTLEQLALLYDSDEEEIAINCYTEYLDALYSIITGEDPPEPPTPPVPSVRFVMGGTLSLTNEGTTTFEEIDYNQLLGIKIRLIETIKETGILSVGE